MKEKQYFNHIQSLQEQDKANFKTSFLISIILNLTLNMHFWLTY